MYFFKLNCKNFRIYFIVIFKVTEEVEEVTEFDDISQLLKR